MPGIKLQNNSKLYRFKLSNRNHTPAHSHVSYTLDRGLQNAKSLNRLSPSNKFNMTMAGSSSTSHLHNTLIRGIINNQLWITVILDEELFPAQPVSTSITVPVITIKQSKLYDKSPHLSHQITSP
jgi:DNA recombination-dependent growth factor C